MPIDRTQPPPHYASPWGFWNDVQGPPNGSIGATGSNHTAVLCDERGYIRAYKNPTTSTGIPGDKDWVPYDPWNPNNPRAVIIPPPQQPDAPAEGGTPVPVDYPGAPPLGPDDNLPPGTPDPNSPPAPTPTTGTPPPAGTSKMAFGRFGIEATFSAKGYPANSVASAHRIVGLDGGYFTFFSDNNPEIYAKYADLTSLPGGQHGLAFAKATDVDFVIKVTDTKTGETQEVRSQDVGGPAWAWFRA